jgi:ParB/RepB/Spo0J family partition protein
MTTTAPSTPARVRIEVDLDKLVISALNTRKRDPRRIEDLAKTIKAVGVVIPPIIRSSRQHPEDAEFFEILDGGYRFLGAQKAKVHKRIECDLEECDDERARQIILMSTERVDMHPLDQADQVLQLLPKFKTEKRVGAALGKSEAWVRDRAKLATLEQGWKDAWRDPKNDLLKISIEGYAELAAAPVEIQVAVRKNADDSGGFCSDDSGWGDPVTTDWMRDALQDELQGAKKLEFPDPPEDGDGEPAAPGKKASKKKPAGPPPVPLKERREQLTKRRMALVLKGIADIVAQRDTLPPTVGAHECAALAMVFGTEHAEEYIGDFIPEHGKPGKAQRAAKLKADLWERMRQIADSTGDNTPMVAAMREIVFDKVVPVLLKRMQFYQVQHIDLGEHGAEAEQVCKLFNLDYADLCSQAERELPEPKSWAGLNANGTPKAEKAKPAKAAAKKEGKKPAPKSKGRREVAPPAKSRGLLNDRGAAELDRVRERAANLLRAKRKGGLPSSMADVPEKYRPDLIAGTWRRYFEFERKLFFDVEIIFASKSKVITRGKDVPEAYTFEHDRELFIKQLAEACLRDTGDELKAGQILEAARG